MSDAEIVVHQEISVVQVDGEDAIVVERERISIVSEGIQGPAGVNGSGMGALAEDPSPELGGDLQLGPYNIVGELENPDFIIDGGLL